MSYITPNMHGTWYHHPMAWLDAIGGRLDGLLETVRNATAASQEFNQLNGLSDKDLLHMGLDRTTLPQYLARKYMQIQTNS